MDASERDTNQLTPAPVGAGELERLHAGTHHDPHQVLGPHVHDGAVTIRTLRPFASTVTVVRG